MSELTLGDALDKLRACLPPEMRADWQKRDLRDAELALVLRTNCLDAIEMIASAARYPRIALSDLESAIAALTVARDCAKALDL